ncbi:hypothetical protein M752DRAFT_266277 [Aspergillus phoenicis ATCC 13157]|uniref:Apple domain-containing protein n=1 Tax=Aspergillus phoenicis ATCC 13157 TaxID=1353007 RepID=A0A370PJV5_ASPPH|nr:hypothetical protein M747DRAFT_305204 [Aspergillus niger ATCC 13496]RDK42478.1 hypothetical protein M752DRAFT_266277 [Aspergillus phoenicis ATCC 13157]
MKLSSFVISLLLTTVGNASAGCLDHISANTMAIFSGAPLAFATDYQTGSQCASYCGSLAECMSWLYSVRGGECQLYKGTALSTFSSQHFMYGVCDGHRNLTTPSAGSSVAAPASPSTSTVFSAMTSGTPPLHLSVMCVQQQSRLCSKNIYPLQMPGGGYMGVVGGYARRNGQRVYVQVLCSPFQTKTPKHADGG